MAITAANGATLDVNAIVSQLMQVEQRPLTRLDLKEAAYQSKLSAYGSLSSAVSTFQSAMNALTNPSALLATRASSADATVVSATATPGATQASYAIEVSALAQQQKLASAGQSALDTAIGSGVLTLRSGTITGGSFDSISGTYAGSTFTDSGNAPVTITIDSSNNTLAGIRDAINSAGAGVTASIVNDGGASPYRLVLTSIASGAASSLKIAVSGDAALATLLAHDPAGTQQLSEKVRAQNAEFKVDGLSVSTSGNSVTDVISGVTLNLAKVNTGSPVNLTVSRDTASTQNLVKGFVDAYNTLHKTMSGLSGIDATSKRPGPLQADGTTSIMTSALRSVMTSSLTAAGRFSTLTQVGVSFQRDGTLSLDSAKLQAATAASAAEFAAVFSQSGRSSDGLISYAGAASQTKAGNYAVNITELATAASATGSAAANLAIIAGVNDTLNVTLDGVSASVTLTAGTYASAAALATEVQSRINAASAYSSIGAKVAVSSSAGVLTLTSGQYGLQSGIRIDSGNGATDLLGASPVLVAGRDVAGTIGGVAATGKGQLLKGAAGSNADGLQVLVAGGATGSRGTLSYSRGIAYQLSELAGRYLDPAGTIANRTQGIQTSLKDIGRQRELVNTRLAFIEQRYRAQYSALDGVLSRMQVTQQYLTQQMDMLSNLTSGSGN